MTSFLRPLLIALALLGIGAIAAIDAQLVRYRDAIFPSVDVTPDLVYGSAPDLYTGVPQTLCLDLYEPTGDTETSRPAAIFIHGGFFISGDKAGSSGQFLGNDLASRGFVVASISYRLAPTLQDVDDDDILAAGEDAKAAVRWLRANAATYGIDPTRISIVGSSAGAFAACEATYNENEGNSGNPVFSSEVNAVVALWGGMRDTAEIQADEAPLCVVHGTLDMIVPFQFSQDLFDAAVAVPIAAELHPFVGVHADLTPYLDVHEEEVVPFLYRHLKLGELAGVAVRPGYAAGLPLTIDVAGEGGFPIALAHAPLTANIPLANLGTLCLDPVTLVVGPLTFLPSSQRISSVPVTQMIPPGVVGTFHMQAVTGGPTGPRLTNCVSVTF